LDVKQLKYFVEVVESGSFSQASRQLNIAQPALSQQVSRLEEEIGSPLLLRTSKGVSPTGKGQMLYRHGKFILRQIDQALQCAKDTAAEVAGRVTIALPPSTNFQIGAGIVERIRARYPGIVLNITEALSAHLRQQAITGDHDMLFSKVGVPGWQSIELVREDLFLIFPVEANVLPTGCREVSLREATRLPLIVPTSRHGLRRRIDLESERIDQPIKPIAEIDSLFVLMRCLIDRGAATIMPHSAVNVFGAENAGRWRCVPISDGSLSRVSYLHTLPADQLSHAAAVVKDEFVSLVYEQVKGRNWLGVSYVGPQPGD
jgi:LysR family transcriptional regulator, regulatory protein for tcuABC